VLTFVEVEDRDRVPIRDSNDAAFDDPGLGGRSRPEVDELIEPDAEAKAMALDLFRNRWKVYRERNGLRG
jgi:hypothetical protein